MEIKTLSIKQPWAWAIIHAGKDIENRTWRTSFRGKVLIHASNSFDEKAYDHLYANKEKYGIKLMPTKEYMIKNSGGLYGLVEITAIRRGVQSVWKDKNSFGWILKNPIALKFVEAKGQLGLFPTELTKKLKKALGVID